MKGSVGWSKYFTTESQRTQSIAARHGVGEEERGKYIDRDSLDPVSSHLIFLSLFFADSMPRGDALCPL